MKKALICPVLPITSSNQVLACFLWSFWVFTSASDAGQMLDNSPLPNALCLTSEVCRISRRGQREVAAVLFVGCTKGPGLVVNYRFPNSHWSHQVSLDRISLQVILSRFYQVFFITICECIKANLSWVGNDTEETFSFSAAFFSLCAPIK